MQLTMSVAENLRQVFSYDNLVHAVSGAVGSTVALSVFYPLDTARTRLQIQDQAKPQFSGKVVAKILQEEGVEALYRGWYPVVTSLCCSNFVYFYVYNSLKAVTFTPGRQSNPAKDLLFAYIAAASNVLTTTPLWVVNTRLKLQGVPNCKPSHISKENHQPYKGITDCLKRIVKEEGVLDLWSGVSPSLVLAFNPAIQWMVYEALKRYLQKKFGVQELSGLAYFVGGAIAKMVATVATYPMQVLQTRLRAGHHQTGNRDMRILDALRDIARTRGLRGMYRGLEAKLTQTVLMSALMFLTYEKIALFVFRVMMRRRAYLSTKSR